MNTNNIIPTPAEFNAAHAIQKPEKYQHGDAFEYLGCSGYCNGCFHDAAHGCTHRTWINRPEGSISHVPQKPPKIDYRSGEDNNGPYLVWQISPGRYRKALTLRKAEAIGKKYAEDEPGAVQIYRLVSEVRRSVEVTVYPYTESENTK